MLYEVITGITDAGGAAVADHVEAEGVEILLQTGLQKVIGDEAANSFDRFNSRNNFV